MALRIVEKAALSDVGRQRQGNEDSFLERSPLFAVADGMGGARAGEVASRIAVEQFDVDDDADNPPEEQLAEVARGANRKIHKMAQEDSAYAGMGTTFTAALVTGREIAIGHVGDSRLYRFRDGELERLTHDHSLVEEFVRQGKLTPAEAEVHPQRSIITRALGPGAGGRGRHLHALGPRRRRLPDQLGRPHRHDQRGEGGGDPARPRVARGRRREADRGRQRERRQGQHHGRPVPARLRR